MTLLLSKKTGKSLKIGKRSEKWYYREKIHDWNLYASNSASNFSLCCSSYNSFICSTCHKMSTTSEQTLTTCQKLLKSFQREIKSFKNISTGCQQHLGLFCFTSSIRSRKFGNLSTFLRTKRCTVTEDIYIVVESALSLSTVGCIMRIVQGLASFVMQSFQRHCYWLPQCYINAWRIDTVKVFFTRE